MIRAVIVEDERLSADRLKGLVERFGHQLKVITILDSVTTAREWLSANPSPDLIFLDIQLNDGTSFDLLAEGLIQCPIIFTTAYDQYAIKAFKYNSIDYLLKPIEPEELKAAIEKFLKGAKNRTAMEKPLVDKFQKLVAGDFKKRFLVKLGEKFQSVEVIDVAYFFYQDGITYLQTKSGKKWPVDQTLDSLDELLNPLEFFRVSRKLIVSLKAISEIHTYFNSRLLLKLVPETTIESVVSRERVSEFKRWMDL